MKRHNTTSSALAEMHNNEETQEAALPSAEKVSKLPENAQPVTAASFWKDRLFEAGMIGSMALYYAFCNASFSLSVFPQANPLFSLPLLLLFAVLCWFRFPNALTLLPLALPFYFYQKPVIGSARFSLTEIVVGVFVLIAVLRLLFVHEDRQLLNWRRLWGRIGPFLLPTLVFLGIAAYTILGAYSEKLALRAFRQEVLEPMLYAAMLLIFLRTRQDVFRLIVAMLSIGLVIALLGIGQMLFFSNTLVPEADGVRRIHTVYGSANSIGLLFDYVIPLALALLVARVFWWNRLLALLLCVPLGWALYLTNSRGALIAIPISAIFVCILAIRSRKVLLLVGSVLLVVLLGGVFLFQEQINEFANGHTDGKGISSLAKRPYIWQTAINMINDRPWFGYGLDNWLCRYSRNDICLTPEPHYWLKVDPKTQKPTGLADEPYISHPHNIFLHVWVSIGVFGLLAFGVTLLLFFWLFIRILIHLRKSQLPDKEYLRWMVVGLGAAILAALIQGQIDSAFLEQDLAFCFWLLVAALLVMRDLSGTLWKERKM
jgi:O-antigen ligase